MQAMKQLIARSAGRVWPIRIERGPCRGMRLYGNIFYNRLPANFKAEEVFYSGLDLTGKTVVEAGAHIGLFTYLFAQTADRVVAFEPNPETYNTASRNIRINKLSNVELINAGLSSGSGKANYVAERFVSARGSLKEDIQSSIRDRSRHVLQTEVQLLSVDEVMQGLPVDFVKIDTEGFETQVLSGMGETINRCLPDIYFEVHGLTDEDKSADLRSILQTLKPAGYEVHHLSEGLPVASTDKARGGYIAFGKMTAYLKAALQPFK